MNSGHNGAPTTPDPAMRFDTYLRYDDLTRALHALAAEHPDLLRVESIGKSFEGRDIWLATATRFDTGVDREKPALWVDGNIHATEVAGSMACLYLLHHLVTGYGQDEAVTRCLDTRVFYVCPRLNPDGAEWALADTPRIIRSSTRPYPYDEEPVAGLRREDIDGDGRVLTMRVPDPNGPWKVSDRDPRLMVRRDPTESGGRYFRLLPEGVIEGWDGVSRSSWRRARSSSISTATFRRAGGRSTSRWGPDRSRPPNPRCARRRTSWPRTRTSPARCCSIPTAACCCVPIRTGPTTRCRPRICWTYQKLGARGTEMTGYPNISVFHDFRYHPKEVITGSFDDWAYDHLGVFAWTVEIWSPQRAAGITDYKFIEWYREHPVEDDLKLLAWNDADARRPRLRRLVSVSPPAAGRDRARRLGRALHLEQSAARAARAGARAAFPSGSCGTCSSRRSWSSSKPARRASAPTPGACGSSCTTRAGCRAT